MTSKKKPAPVPSKRLFARFEKAWIETLPERDRIILGVCRMFPNGFGTDGAERLELAGFDPEDPRGQEILGTFARWSALPGQEALWTGVLLGKALGRHSAECEARAVAGNRSLEDTRGPELKGKLIRHHLSARPNEGFASYWRSLCEPARYIADFLASWGVAHRGEQAGTVTLWNGAETVTIEKESHARLFRKKKAEL